MRALRCQYAPRCTGLLAQALACAAVLLAALPASAHESPGDVVHALTHRIESRGPTARLLAARAFEYQYLSQWNEAIADFEAALDLRPDYPAALNGLAHTLLRQGALERAASAARAGLARAEDPEREVPYHAVLARVHARAERWEPALDAWRAALQSERPEVDWFLGEAACLARLGRYADRAAALDRARQRNPSAVLHRAWVRALVDAGEYRTAMPEVEQALAGARWKSTWLLLRARIHGGQGRTGARKADARAALEEINARWHPGHPDPDPYLLAQAGAAFALLGRPEEARAHLDEARQRGVPRERLAEIADVIESLPAAPP